MEFWERGYDILELIAQGYINKIIASKLGLAEGTVKKRTQRIYGKLGVNSKSQAALVYRNNGGSQGSLEKL